MKLIRNEIFEVNSSSCHSISIDNNNIFFQKVDLTDGDFYIYAEEFGWNKDIYYDYNIKCSYIAIYIRDWCNNKEQYLEVFENCIKDYTQCNSIIYNNDFMNSNLWDKGFIDHQSVENGNYDYLFDKNHIDYKEGELKNFLFNIHSHLETGNDNE